MHLASSLPEVKHMKAAHRKDYISEEDFNRIVGSAGVPIPDDDSKDDSAADENAEIEIGEDYPESALDDIREEEDEAAGDQSSTWPDPAKISK
jgi:hypothetical protein